MKPIVIAAGRAGRRVYNAMHQSNTRADLQGRQKIILHRTKVLVNIHSTDVEKQLARCKPQMLPVDPQG